MLGHNIYFFNWVLWYLEKWKNSYFLDNAKKGVHVAYLIEVYLSINNWQESYCYWWRPKIRIYRFIWTFRREPAAWNFNSQTPVFGPANFHIYAAVSGPAAKNPRPASSKMAWRRLGELLKTTCFRYLVTNIGHSWNPTSNQLAAQWNTLIIYSNVLRSWNTGKLPRTLHKNKHYW